MAESESAKSSRGEDVLDRKTLDGLRSLQRPGNPDVYKMILSSFLHTSGHHMEAIRTAISQQNSTHLFQAAHSLKSSSALIGATVLSERAKPLELLGRSSSFQGVEELLRQLETIYASTTAALLEEIGAKTT